MAELIPYPFGKLVTRAFRELEKKQSIFDLPVKKFFLGDPHKDFSVRFHSKKASSPLGPASGPQTQLAQNIVLCWLGGSRIIELKTVQIMDDLKIPRPCIDMQNVGYNVEWSQELKVRQSLEEYVKASMLIEILAASKKLELAEGFGRVIYDMSLGYDLKGITSDKVQFFVKGMQNAADWVEKFRKQIPDEFKEFRSLNFETKLSDSMTLSTFHGCPPDEIEKIIDFCLKKNRLNCVIKLNPVLLGKEETRQLFNETLGYKEVRIPDSAFDKDTQWGQAVEMAGRLQETAQSMGLSCGVKFSNTLIVENHKNFFQNSEKIMYLSGLPLHVLAMNLVLKWRKVFGSPAKISFAAGVDRTNFADAVALGLTPITVCSDWLKTGGYQRQAGYYEELIKRMDQIQAGSIGDFIIRCLGSAETSLKETIKALKNGLSGPEENSLVQAIGSKVNLEAAVKKINKDNSLNDFYQRWVKEAALLNTFIQVPKIIQDARYTQNQNKNAPKKVGSKLDLFNCLTCDKCIPVCPNDANFTYTLPQIEIPVTELSWEENRWVANEKEKILFNKKHQIANFADFCNECGNCDIFCPEDGGPYLVKPRFFGSLDSWKNLKSHDGFYLEKSNGNRKIWGRFKGIEYALQINPSGDAIFEGDHFSIEVQGTEPNGSSIKSRGSGHPVHGARIDFTYYHILNWLGKAVFSENEVNYVNI